MSMQIIEGLGQTPEQAIQPVPITDIQAQAYAGLQMFWNRVREECEERFTPGQCQALLGVRPTILQPRRQDEGIKWYWWLLIGVGVGKVIL